MPFSGHFANNVAKKNTITSNLREKKDAFIWIPK